MRDNRHHTNLWAERLSQVSLPDGDAAWKGMEMLLDKQMPVRKDRRRWILLVLLLLLLIGVCNCPGRPGSRVPHGGGEPVVRGSDGGERAAEGSERVRGGSETIRSGSERVRGGSETIRSGSESVRGGSETIRSGSERVRGGSQTIRSGSESVRGGGGSVSGGVEPAGNAESPAGATAAGRTPNSGRPGANPTPAEKNEAEPPITTRAKTATTPGSKDSTSSQKKKVTTPPAEEKKQQRANGWTVGIGLNQFFTVGGQQASHYNSGGISGALGDYIPVPMVRYHFNRKFFIQLEAQLNSPQYTGKNLVISLPPLDSLSPTVRRQSSVLIKKLFYFNVPLSLHYKVFRGVDLGAGVQFSRLSNGIGLFQDRTINIGPGGIPDSLTATSKSFKGDTLYKKIRTTELRAMLDASYTQGRFIFGVRYNQALSQFIHIQVAPGQITQARNSSLQLYLRYVLWDNQKKAPYQTK